MPVQDWTLSGAIWKHLQPFGSIWSHLGHLETGDNQESPRRHPLGTQEAPRRHPEGTQVAPRRHPGDTQKAPRLQRTSRQHLKVRSQKTSLSLSNSMQKFLEQKSFHKFVFVGTIDYVYIFQQHLRCGKTDALARESWRLDPSCQDPFIAEAV